MSTIYPLNSINSNIDSAHLVENASYWTDAKIKKIAFYTFATLLGAAALGTAILATSGLELLAIPLFIASVATGYYTHKIKDYQDPNELRLYRAEAKTMTFKEIYEQHGLKNAIQYALLPLDELKEKFHFQILSMDFSDVIDSFNLDQLLLYKIATPDHISLLRELNVKGTELREQFKQGQAILDLRFQGRTEALRKKIQEARIFFNVAAAATAGGNAKNRADAYARANSVTTPLAYLGEIIADGVGVDSQITYEHKMAKLRTRFNDQMTQLEERYNQHKHQLFTC